jgi:acyl carrier protein
MNISNKVKEIIADAIEVEVTKIEEDTAIGDFPKWDSMGQIIIISALEKEFDIKFDPEVIMDLEDVGDMIDAVEERVSQMK